MPKAPTPSGAEVDAAVRRCGVVGAARGLGLPTGAVERMAANTRREMREERKARNHQVIRRLDEGASPTAVAAEFGLSRSFVYGLRARRERWE